MVPMGTHLAPQKKTSGNSCLLNLRIKIAFNCSLIFFFIFCITGKALCLLTKQDLGERCPGAGDLIYNVLRWLIRDGFSAGQHLPQSPVTPHFPITPSWCLPIPPPQEYPHVTSTPTTLHNSVTLSPAPSVDSQSGSPKQPDQSTSSAFSAVSSGKTMFFPQYLLFI